MTEERRHDDPRLAQMHELMIRVDERVGALIEKDNDKESRIRRLEQSAKIAATGGTAGAATGLGAAFYAIWQIIKNTGAGQ